MYGHASATAQLRTWLFAPGDRPALMTKALSGGADAVILDLEDAVARDSKTEARERVRDALLQSDRPNRHVRINDLRTEFALEDVMAVVAAAPTGIMLPKAQTAFDIRILDWLIGLAERRAGRPPGSTEITPLIETAAGVVNAGEIATASSRVQRLSFGAGDFTLDTGMTWSDDERELHLARSTLVLVSRTFGLEAPIDAVWVRIDDQDGFVASAIRTRDHGFQGKMCIHPTQLALVRSTFAPDAGALMKAREIVRAFEAALAADRGAIRVAGQLIDQPIYLAAVRTCMDADRAMV